MNVQTDQTRTIVVEGTIETLEAQINDIQAAGGRIVSVRVVPPAGPDYPPSTFEIVYTDGN